MLVSQDRQYLVDKIARETQKKMQASDTEAVA